MAAKFTRKQLSESTDNKVAFIIDNYVYDVTGFLDEHPGGHEVLNNVKGTDASENFADVGHSVDAKELMLKYKIGELVDEDKTKLVKKQQDWQTEQNLDEPSFVSSWKFPLVLGIVMTVLYSYLFG